MLFFRSEEHVERWCRRRGVTPGPVMPFASVWRLAQAWYASRLDPAARRPTLDEARAILAASGFTGPFWDPG